MTILYNEEKNNTPSFVYNLKGNLHNSSDCISLFSVTFMSRQRRQMTKKIQYIIVRFTGWIVGSFVTFLLFRCISTTKLTKPPTQVSRNINKQLKNFVCAQLIFKSFYCNLIWQRCLIWKHEFPSNFLSLSHTLW